MTDMLVPSMIVFDGNLHSEVAFSLAASQSRAVARALTIVAVVAAAAAIYPPYAISGIEFRGWRKRPQPCGHSAWSLRVSALNHSGIRQSPCTLPLSWFELVVSILRAYSRNGVAS